MAGRIAYTGGIVTNGLVLNLDAAKRDSYPGSGTVWRDIAGSSVVGTLTNGPTFNSDNGGSIVFDGTNDYVNIPTITATSTLTIECVFNSQNNNFKNLLYCASSDPYSPRISLRNNVINLYYQTSLGSGDIIFTYPSISTNSFNHLMITYDSINNHICYINGVTGVRSSNSTALNAVPTYTFIRMGIGAGSEGYFLGKIASLRIYNRALSSTEVLQNYNSLKGRYGL